MKALAIDCATPLASVAVVEDGRLVGEVALSTGRGHSEHLLEAVRFLLDRLGWTPLDPDLFVATTGPGLFTGLRIGIGTIRGLAMAAGKPASGISTLAAMAGAMGAPGVRLASLLDAGRGEVYAGLFSGDDPPAPLRDEALVDPEDLREYIGSGPALAFGTGAARYAKHLARLEDHGVRTLNWQGALAAPAAILAARLLDRGARLSDLPLSARYIRRSDARLPRHA